LTATGILLFVFVAIPIAALIGWFLRQVWDGFTGHH
jgi:hypothetical protein